MNWNREVSKNLEHTKIGIKDWRDTAERRHVLKQARRWARWQRDQLRSNEAIERVAIRILADDASLSALEGSEDWAELTEDRKRLYRDVAREHITALLGED